MHVDSVKCANCRDLTYHGAQWPWPAPARVGWLCPGCSTSNNPGAPSCFGCDGRPVPLVMHCPAGHPHVDEGEWATRPHRTHQCQVLVPCAACEAGDEWCEKTRICGLEWRPAQFPTVGVAATKPA